MLFIEKLPRKEKQMRYPKCSVCLTIGPSITLGLRNDMNVLKAPLARFVPERAEYCLKCAAAYMNEFNVNNPNTTTLTPEVTESWLLEEWQKRNESQKD